MVDFLRLINVNAGGLQLKKGPGNFTPNFLAVKNLMKFLVATHFNPIFAVGPPKSAKVRMLEKGVEFKGGSLHDSFGSFAGSGEHLQMLQIRVETGNTSKSPKTKSCKVLGNRFPPRRRNGFLRDLPESAFACVCLTNTGQRSNRAGSAVIAVSVLTATLQGLKLNPPFPTS